jgi:hypothetical protein
MSFIHYLFLGHFEHDGPVMRFSKAPGESTYRPVVRRSLDPEAIKSALREVKGAAGDEPTFPDDWMVWQEDGYLVCDKYTRDPQVVAFITRLAEQTRCDIHDASAHCDITVNDWPAATAYQPQAKKGPG